MKLKLTKDDSGWWVAFVNGARGRGATKVEAVEGALKTILTSKPKLTRAKPMGQAVQRNVLYLEGDLFDKFCRSDRSVKALAELLVKNHDRSAPTGEA